MPGGGHVGGGDDGVLPVLEGGLAVGGAEVLGDPAFVGLTPGGDGGGDAGGGGALGGGRGAEGVGEEVAVGMDR